jgi:hypothetical protein
MRFDRFPLIVTALILGGCVANLSSSVVDDSPIWGRIDCQRGEGNPALLAEFDQAKTVCLSRGESSAAVAGAAGNNPCMSEQGYILRTRSEHKAVCEAAPARTERSVARKRTATSKPIIATPSSAPSEVTAPKQ